MVKSVPIYGYCITALYYGSKVIYYNHYIIALYNIIFKWIIENYTKLEILKLIYNNKYN